MQDEDAVGEVDVNDTTTETAACVDQARKRRPNRPALMPGLERTSAYDLDGAILKNLLLMPDSEVKSALFRKMRLEKLIRDDNHTATLEGLTGLHCPEAETALWAEEHLLGQCW